MVKKKFHNTNKESSKKWYEPYLSKEDSSSNYAFRTAFSKLEEEDNKKLDELLNNK